MNECWHLIEDSHYSISNMGRVRNDRTGKILKNMKTNKDTYEEVDIIWSRKHIKRYKVHVLVARYFVDNPTNLPEVNHKDGNKHNNVASNLEWCTRSYNLKHAYSNGLRSAKGECNANSKLTKEDVDYIRAHYRRGVNQNNLGNSKELIEKFGITRVQLIKIVNNKAWR